MTFARPDHIGDLDTLPRMPAWVTSARSEALEDVAFLSGAALKLLHLVLGREDVPHALMRDRLALSATEACVTFSGRPERARELRDLLHLLRPGDLPTFEPGQIATWLNTGQGTPVARAATVLETVLREAPRADVPALVLAEASLAQSLGWKHVVPLLAPGLKRADLRKQGDDLRLACH